MASPARHSLQERYAAALFDALSDKAQRDSADKELVQLQTLIDTSSELQHLIRSPLLNRSAQTAAILAVAQKMGFGETVQKFLGTVAKNGRLKFLPSIIKAFQKLVAHEKGEQTVIVATARPMTTDQRHALLKTLAEGQYKNLRLEETTDPSLLGGLQVKIGSTIIDTSLRTQLQHLEKTMKGAA